MRYALKFFFITLLGICLLTPLVGCAGKDTDRSGAMSLEERYYSGKTLLPGEDDVEVSQEAAVQAKEHLSRGMSLLARERSDQAFEQFSRAASLDPSLAQARFQRGLMLYNQGTLEGALVDMTAVLALEPDNGRAHEIAGAIHFTSGKLDEARNMFEKAVALDPDLEGSHAFLAATHLYDKNYDAALQVLERAFATHPNSGMLHNNMGLVLAAMGRDAEAVDYFNRAIALGGQDPKTYNNMGLALCRMGLYDQAIVAFRNADSEAVAYNNVGYFLFWEGKYDEAVRYLEKAVTLAPRYYARAAENLKKAQLAQGLGLEGQVQPLNVGVTPQVQLTPVSAADAGLRTEDVVDGAASPALSTPKESAAVQAQPQQLQEGELEKGLAAYLKRTGQGAQQESDQKMAEKPATASRHRAQQKPIAPIASQSAPASQHMVWAVHESSWRNVKNARGRVAELQQKGFPAWVAVFHTKDKGTWHRVMLGKYATRSEAEKRQKALTSAGGFDELRSLRIASDKPAEAGS